MERRSQEPWKLPSLPLGVQHKLLASVITVFAVGGQKRAVLQILAVLAARSAAAMELALRRASVSVSQPQILVVATTSAAASYVASVFAAKLEGFAVLNSIFAAIPPAPKSVLPTSPISVA